MNYGTLFTNKQSFLIKKKFKFMNARWAKSGCSYIKLGRLQIIDDWSNEIETNILDYSMDTNSLCSGFRTRPR